MALLTVDFGSDVLHMDTSMTVVLPETTLVDDEGVASTARPADPPVLYLLHGLSDDHTSWLRWTSAPRYAEEAGLALVMPAVARSFYADEAHGHQYWTFLTEELPAVVTAFFGLTQRPADTFVAGLSMGGYGALKWALRQPGRFAAAASMSGVLDIRRALATADRDELRERVFDGTVGDDDDLLTLLDTSDLPPLWVGCGTDDVLYSGNRRFVEVARAAGRDITVDFRPGGHAWALWEAMLPDVLAWLPRGSTG